MENLEALVSQALDAVQQCVDVNALEQVRVADEVGFHSVWAVEHHFADYSFCPDNLQLMAHLAAIWRDRYLREKGKVA